MTSLVAVSSILVRSLFGFLEDALNVLFAARRKAMEPCKRQLFLQLYDRL